ncbi:MAG: hypothetical protein G3M78_07450 [Candidatus Nitrohelix vancouverensis]|uniref:SMP-30/Gluconolactonase/LRE-like region domain-containing protein n=1 Tax=Candidatus Nitrohelix vancouverensis TaxID=2705534 RepID=A0A7T0C2D9_9BACT|nr:MAG: hypothetical protein G3M78_07450 [Candidatus Nitrohelix vancouverensis]
MKRYALFITILTFLTAPPSASAFNVSGLKKPESFIIDPATGSYYISNVNGGARQKNNNGFITKLFPDGSIENLNFIQSGRLGTTLHAPKGLAIVGERLYVTDIDRVCFFDKASGKFLGSIGLSIMGARFLNDIAADPEGNLYISDTHANIIFKLSRGQSYAASILAKGSRLRNPNGLVYDAARKRLLAAAYGSGEILSVANDGSIRPAVPGKMKRPDGMDFDRSGRLIVSSFSTGKIYLISDFSNMEILRENLVTPADISYDFRNNQVLVPSFNGNGAFTIPLH